MFVKLMLRQCVSGTKLALVKNSNILRKTTTTINLSRLKYTAAGSSGVKGGKSGRQIKKLHEADNEFEEIPINEHFDLENDLDYDMIVNNAMHVTKTAANEQNVFVIQPYIKWGPKKLDTNPELQLCEAESLVKSLPAWNIGQSLKIPLESFQKRSLFGAGKLDEIKTMIKNLNNSNDRITSIFVSKGTLSGAQKRFLEHFFGLPVFDRYSIVIQILRLHAKSTEAKLQVAMAEIPYIWSQYRDSDKPTDKRASVTLNDSQKQILRNREKKLKYELENIRAHRELLRNRRKQKNYPIVAVVGYTNAGKTSLIKALTGEEKLQPKNQLFATLDVTAHAGRLPCQLEVIYMDTVGFMSDIPTGLIECFIATLEDAMLADIIIHVQDIAHENHCEQRKHVEATLQSLIEKSDLYKLHASKIINVGNKADLVLKTVDKGSDGSVDVDLKIISSTTLAGISGLLDEIESRILKVTRRIKLIVKVPMGGEEMAWLYKNAAIGESHADPNDSQLMMLNVVIAEPKLEQFKYKYLRKK